MTSLPVEIIAVAQVDGALNITIRIPIQDGRVSFSFPQQPSPVQVVAPVCHKDHYETMDIPELILLCHQRGLALSAPRKKDFIERLCAYDARNVGASPYVKDMNQNEHVISRNYTALEWCELYALCRSRGMKILSDCKKVVMVPMLQEHDRRYPSGVALGSSSANTYESMRNVDLHKLCQERGMKNLARLKKDDRIRLLRESDGAN